MSSFNRQNRLVIHTEERSGAQIVAENTVNAGFACTIFGKSVQSGTPTPTAPLPIVSAGNFAVQSSGRDALAATSAQITEQLQSVKAVKDSIEMSAGRVELVRRCATKTLCGASYETWSQYAGSAGKQYACLFGPLLTDKRSGAIDCTHDLQTSNAAVLNGLQLGIWTHTDQTVARYMYWGLAYSLLGTSAAATAGENVAALRSWLSAQTAAGTPVTIHYQLAEPIRTDITATPTGQALLAMQTTQRYTRLSTTDPLQPSMTVQLTLLGR